MSTGGDGFRNQAASILIAGDPGGAHVTIDANGVNVYDSTGTLVSSLNPTQGLFVEDPNASVLIGNPSGGHILIGPNAGNPEIQVFDNSGNAVVVLDPTFGMQVSNMTASFTVGDTVAGPYMRVGNLGGGNIGFEVFDNTLAQVLLLDPTAGLFLNATNASIQIGNVNSPGSYAFAVDNSELVFAANNAGVVKFGTDIVPGSVGGTNTTTLNQDWLEVNQILMPAPSTIVGGTGSGGGRMHIQPNASGTPVTFFMATDGVQFLNLVGGNAIGMSNGPLTIFSGFRGSVTVTLTNGTNNSTGTVTFPASFPFTAPTVVLSVTPFTGNTPLVAMVNTVSVSSFTYRIMFGTVPAVNFGATTTVTMYWMAS